MMSTEAVVTSSHIHWRGLQFDRLPTPHHNAAETYKAGNHEMAPLRGAWISHNASGQWIAKFENGSYSIAWSIDEALEEAVWSALDFSLLDAARLRKLVAPGLP